MVSSAPAHAANFALAGTVTGADTGLGIPYIQVSVRNPSNFDYAQTTADSSGHFQIDTVPNPGNYVLYFSASSVGGGYVNEYYGHSIFPESATLLSLSNSSGVIANAALPKGGSIYGNITIDGQTSVELGGETHIGGFAIYATNTATQQWDRIVSSGIYPDGHWEYGNLAPGAYRVKFNDNAINPIYSDEYYNDVADIADATDITVSANVTTSGIDADLTLDGPSPVVRLAGNDRFATSARIAETYSSADVVFVANGLGYPDALSAAPAAAFLDAPLLLTQKDSLPAVVKTQIQRLIPDTIYVVGGTGVVSNAVFNELLPLATHVIRLAGSTRYETSTAVFEATWNGSDAATAFLADGRNYPDALASASAAGKVGGPVILVNGGSSSVPTGFGDLLQPFNTAHVTLAGGTSVLSAGIQSSADALPGIDVERYFGANRYATSWAINNHFFASATSVYLAVGSGYADALAGAALAGHSQSPLYLVPGNCVPQNVLDAISTLGATRIVLFGGTGVLSPAVEALTPCSA